MFMKAVNVVRLDGLSVQEWRTALIGSADCKPRRNEEKPRRTGCEGWLVEQEIDTGGFHREHAGVDGKQGVGLVFLFCRCGISRILSKFAIAKTAEADRRTRPGGEDRAMAHLQHATLANNNRRICRQ